MAASQCAQLIGSMSLAEMNREINYSYASVEFASLSPGKVPNDTMTDISYFLLLPTKRQWHS